MIDKRIYVGCVENNREECFSELYTRFQKFGTCKEVTFEQHNTFAYLNMSFEDDSQFEKLKASFNRVKFKGNTLRVAEAKMHWKLRWEMENNDEERENKKRKQIQKQEWEHYKKLENIKMSWIDRKQLISGRERSSPRSQYKLRNITFRINVKGNLKTYKCHKTKLWGYEKNKQIRDLVYKFADNYWKSSTGHIVDKLDYSRVSGVCFKNSSGDILTLSHKENSQNAEAVDEEDISDSEKEKNNGILASVLGSFNFENPISVENDDEDEDGGADYEHEAIYTQDKTFRSSYNESASIEHTREGEYAKSEPSTIMNDKEDYDSDISEEFIPRFGQTKSSDNKGNTETLRDLFNPAQATSFKLIEESDDDIDHGRDIREEQLAPIVPEKVQSKPTNKPLFFVHSNSPFLVGQTRISKIKPTSTLEDKFGNWEDTFWSNRSNWTKEMKQKRRDAVRQIRKKKEKFHNGTTLV